MKNQLSSNFSISKYGLSCRFVNEKDAEFILKLRTSPKVATFLHYTEDSLPNQIQWIKSYKEREKDGLEFYFLFESDNKEVGVFRLYNIHGETFTGGSWTFIDESSMEQSIAGVLISLDIAFDYLGMNVDDIYDGVHEKNKKVLRFNKLLGVDFYGTRNDKDGKFFIGKLTRESYLKNRPKLLNIIGY